MRAEQVRVLVFVAGGYQLLQFQLLKIVCEAVEEVADPRIVTVAQNGLTFEVRRVVLQFFFDVRRWV